MPRRKFIDKKTATTFALVHRSGDDPLINDNDAPSMVFAEKQTYQPRSLRRAREDDYAFSSAGSVLSDSSYQRSAKVKERGDLEEEFGLAVRANEGEAAQHGVFYDDTEYDYMQHMRDLGEGKGGSVMWVEASAPPSAKRKQRLEDALNEASLDDDVRSFGTADTGASKARSLLPEEVLPSEFVRKRTYQDQQDVPDDIAGFQPDMDERLREVLEALEDEEYIDDVDEEDAFGQLIAEGEVDEDEFDFLGEQLLMDGEDGGAFQGAGEDDDGWESDDTIKAASPPRISSDAAAPSLDELKDQGEMLHPPTNTQAQPPADPTAGAWLDEYKKFKTAAKSSTTATPEAPAPVLTSNLPSTAPTTRTRKSRKANAASTNFSMTSSTLSRTDHQRLLDSRFDKLESNYAASRFPEDDMPDNMSGIGSMASGVSGMSGLSRMSGMSRASTLSQARESGPKSVRADFDGMIDGFLAEMGSAKGGKRKGMRRGKVGDDGQGLKELEEVRRGLGPARLKGVGPTGTGGG